MFQLFNKPFSGCDISFY